ncbi:acyltransferase family protein [Microbulbifer thermotolerans]|uniref:Acyltransferase n=1 Tax=Microbulbifer thermotolerans TaxID=252514 RepID=A0A143HNH6_MICTH|nr:acyltransferase [Microbulbifer thermotolerans]AMX03047.1 hypothetical protein A3224_11145 [Microbulbifer thermotolerans]MCX2779011.1 acyltransferase [Microbulbifer thermotolerans]MCX2781478.1 acyltransferase [Microbulbifer thermotolerans]MCX2795717.1 acyltransferase [Microbulbifer thermotolerans]MCX2802041.1 acyltransferase [Microbulbifer thermotolerans]
MNSRFFNLDALRGIAALLVVWQHSSELFVRNPRIAQHGTALADIASTVDFGRIGVICFFLISGFVIPYSLSETESSLKRFAIRRFFRLYPPYWISLLAAIVFTVFVDNSHLSTGTIVANITMLQGLFGYENIQGLYWTLTIELIFYCLVALLFAMKLLNRPAALLLACLSNLFIFVVWQLAGKFMPQLTNLPSPITYTPFCLAVMFCGALIRHTYINRSDYHYTILGVFTVFSLPLAVLTLGLLGHNLVNNPARFGLSHLIALVVFLGGLLMRKTPPRQFLYLGLISYSVYLFHPIAIKVLDWSIQQQWGLPLANLSLGFYIFITTLFAIAISHLIYQVIERPSIAIGRALTQSAKSQLNFA